MLLTKRIPMPAWPKGLERVFRPIANVLFDPNERRVQDRKLKAYTNEEMQATVRDHRSLRSSPQRAHHSALTGTWSELIFGNRADYTANASTSTETSLLVGVNQQPVLPALFFNDLRGFGRTVSLWGGGVVGSTGTPTNTFQLRLGTSSGASSLAGTSVGVSAAITMASSVTNKYWMFRLDLTCYTPGIGSGNTTLSGAGFITSPGGFASPFTYALEPTTPDTATWTITIDNSVTQYFNVSNTWSASSASNTMQLKQLFLAGHN